MHDTLLSSGAKPRTRTRRRWRLTFGLRIFDRYLARQVFSGALTGVMVLTGVLVLGNIFKKLDQLLGDTTLPFSALIKFILYIIPFSLIFTIPWAFLTAILLTYGRLSADNELTALRMTGMSMPRICAPIFLMAGMFMAVGYYVNIDLAPYTKQKIKALFLDVALENPAELFQEGKVLDQLPEYRIYTRKREGNKLYDVQIFHTMQGFEESYIRAREALVIYTSGQTEFQLKLKKALRSGSKAKNGEEIAPINDIQPADFEELNITLSLQKLKEQMARVNPSLKNTSELWGELQTGLDSRSGAPQDKRAKCASMTELNMRYSMSLACLTFCFVGIPLGITAQRRETSVGFVISLGVACAYMGIIIFATTLNESPGSYPYFLVWVPNVLFLSVGSYMFWKLSRK